VTLPDRVSLEALLNTIGGEPDLVRWGEVLALLDPADVPTLAIPADGWVSMPLAAAPDWELVLFAMPKDAAIPLHDHPGMHVLTRVVQGALRAEIWDVPHPGRPELATPAPDRTLTPEQPPHLTTPTAANVHGLTALEDTLFLDLFSPYYDPPARACSYYRVVDGQTLVRAGDGHGE
jgi:hypothetical protein